MSETTEKPSAQEKPKRNPAERLIVWGGIVILLLVVGNEARARFGYELTLSKLQSRIHQDEGDDPNPLTVDEANSLVVGFPSKTDENGKITYRFRGLIKEFGAIHLTHDGEDLVLGLETDAPPEVEEPEFGPSSGDDPTEMEEMEMGMGAAMGSGGPPEGGPGGGRNFDPMQFDEDGDGKISLDEAPDRMKEFFEQIDTNGDGFADAEEFAARRAARQREGGGPGGDGGGRPRRPEADNGESAEETDAATPEVDGDESAGESDGAAPEAVAKPAEESE